MDAYLLRMLAPALENLLSGARIEKIQEFAPGHLGITFFTGEGKRHLYIRFDRQQPFCFISSRRIQGLPQPSAQVMRFRKYCSGRKLAAVVVQIWSRKIWMLVSGAQMQKGAWLCLNLARGPELHFLEETKAPEAETALWPETADLPDALSDWQKWTTLTPALRKAMASLEAPERAALLADLADGGGDVFLQLDQENKIRKISAWPLPNLNSFREESHPPSLAVFEQAGFDLVLDALSRRQEKERAAPGVRRLKKINQILDKMDQDEKRLVQMQAKENDARLIQANLWRFPADYRGESVKLESSDGSRKIVLQKRFSLLENMERMFHEARRGKTGLARLAERRAALENEKLALQGGAVVVPRPGTIQKPKPVALRLPPHCAGFISSDGYQILRGKDAKGNLAIRKLASPHDLWAHVEEGSGAHVIIRRSHAADEVPERTLLEAGSLAANKSWLASASEGNVMYAELRHVKPVRKGPTGKVTIDKIQEIRRVPLDPDLEEKLRIVSSDHDKGNR